MLSNWPIRKKLTLGIALLLIAVAILAFSGFRGVYAFRGLVRSVSQRASELPIAIDLAHHVSELRATEPSWLRESELQVDKEHSMSEAFFNFEFTRNLDGVSRTLARYRDKLHENASADARIGNIQRELETVQQMNNTLRELESLKVDDSWPYGDQERMEELRAGVEQLGFLADRLPSYLQEQMNDLQGDVKVHYRTWIVLTWFTSFSAGSLLLLMVHLFYRWIFRPLRTLIEGSRHVAGGNFDHRIRLNSGDEMDELAMAMNNMTMRFQQIRDDLDQQVQQRTKEVVRGEQLASVGFLAAGVAHEINNPLASIAFCADSLVDRLQDVIPAAQDHEKNEEDESNSEMAVVSEYLRMIQEEAFRCKEITERLLDFSRLGDVEKQSLDLRDLVQGVIDMVRHLGTYKQKEIIYNCPDPVIAPINPQEMKQVVLNLITNGLESLDPGGVVSVSLSSVNDHAELVVADNGCGMTDEVKNHLFEPFYTRGKDGQGTGLGMSITFRIVTEHGGRIDVHSDGPGKGSVLTVRLPLNETATQEKHHHYKAA